MIDFDELLLGPQYLLTGTAITVALASTGEQFDMTALDETKGVVVGDRVNVATVRAAFAIRPADLAAAGKARRDLIGGTVSIADRDTVWTIEAIEPRLTEAGTETGELLLILSE